MWDGSIKELTTDKLGKLRQRIAGLQFIALSAVFGALAWVLDAIVDLLIFNEKGMSFFDVLIGRLAAFELYVRLVISGSFFVFGIIVSVFLAKRKKAEEALRDNEVKLRAILESIPDAVTVTDINGNITGFNQATMDLHGFSTLEKLSGMNILDLIAPQDRQRIMAIMQESATQDFVRDVEFIGLTEDGHEFAAELSASVIRDQSGDPVFFVSIIKDITQRKQAESALRESERRYQILFEDAPDAIFIGDTESGRILDANPAASRLLLKSHEEIVKLYQPEVHPPQIREYVQKQFSVNARAEGQLQRIESIVLRSDGREVPVEISAHIINLPNKPVMQAIFRDITERKRMEEELLRTQKFESIGVFAGGIAHDLNNLLIGVIWNISLARGSTNPADRDEKLAEAERESMRIKGLTRQLLTFAKGGTPILHTATVGSLLKDSTTFALRGSNVRCEFAIPDDLWAVEIDEGQMNQVVNNLMINAKQAMPDGGVINVRCENIVLDSERSLPLDAGAYIKISVEDQGIGITPEHLQKIFDPFFTTKQEGSGLGLATSYSIIQKHNGHISVESRIGLGTAFHIYLPASSKQAVIVEEKVENRLTRGEGKVLVMDDEEHLRNLANGVLGSMGYKVTTATDGEETIQLYEAAMDSGHPFDAVIMDLTIPGGMGGKDAIKKLAEMDPGVKAIVSSGYSTDPVMADFKEYGFSGVIAKPYRISELSELLHGVINGV